MLSDFTESRSSVTDRPRPLWLGAILVAVLVPIFGGLGVWQLQRADAKQMLQQELDQRAREAPLRLQPSPQSVEALRFRRVLARGQYDPDYQILLDNRVHQGIAGYFVLTPLRLEGSDTRVLVNRGWVALGESRERLPSTPTPTGLQEISGVAIVPQEKVFTLASPPLERGWQPVWSHLDMTRYARSVPFALQPVVILLDAGEAGGFVREWMRLDSGITVHQGYAFQWFALAMAAAVIFICIVHARVGKRRRRRRST